MAQMRRESSHPEQFRSDVVFTLPHLNEPPPYSDADQPGRWLEVDLEQRGATPEPSGRSFVHRHNRLTITSDDVLLIQRITLSGGHPEYWLHLRADAAEDYFRLTNASIDRHVAIMREGRIVALPVIIEPTRTPIAAWLTPEQAAEIEAAIGRDIRDRRWLTVLGDLAVWPLAVFGSIWWLVLIFLRPSTRWMFAALPLVIAGSAFALTTHQLYDALLVEARGWEGFGTTAPDDLAALSLHALIWNTLRSVPSLILGILGGMLMVGLVHFVRLPPQRMDGPENS